MPRLDFDISRLTSYVQRDFFTPTRSQYSMSLHLLQKGETGWQRFCP